MKKNFFPLYVNGVPAAEDTTDIPLKISHAGLFKMGRRANTTNRSFGDGLIDELQIVAYAMDASEINGLMAANTTATINGKRSSRQWRNGRFRPGFSVSGMCGEKKGLSPLCR
ncbi:MAG: hypothetical protein KC421_27075 [Anaerolineales bacterium]|nr:hypothetical protein [Anaerolineales bacterium]